MKLRTIHEAAEALGLSRRKLKEGIAQGKYPAVKWGSRLLVDADALERILAEERAAAPTVSARECAEAIGVSESTLRRMARTGLVPFRREGRRGLFVVDEVIQELEGRMRR